MSTVAWGSVGQGHCGTWKNVSALGQIWSPQVETRNTMSLKTSGREVVAVNYF